MTNVRKRAIRKLAKVAVPCLSLLLLTSLAKGQNANSYYVLLLASGPLCEGSEAPGCPAIAKGSRSDTYEMRGAGTFDAQSKLVKAAGTFAHKSLNGDVLRTGVWIAEELLSFESYGAAPTALQNQKGIGFVPKGAKGPSVGFGPIPTGGLAVLRIRLFPLQGAPETAMLQINCALGNVPGQRSVEGIRVTLERNKMEYSEEIGGRVMFLAVRPAVSAPANPTQEQEEVAPEAAESRDNGRQD